MPATIQRTGFLFHQVLCTAGLGSTTVRIKFARHGNKRLPERIEPETLES